MEFKINESHDCTNEFIWHGVDGDTFIMLQYSTLWTENRGDSLRHDGLGYADVSSSSSSGIRWARAACEMPYLDKATNWRTCRAAQFTLVQCGSLRRLAPSLENSISFQRTLHRSPTASTPLRASTPLPAPFPHRRQPHP